MYPCIHISVYLSINLSTNLSVLSNLSNLQYLIYLSVCLSIQRISLSLSVFLCFFLSFFLYLPLSLSNYCPILCWLIQDNRNSTRSYRWAKGRGQGTLLVCLNTCGTPSGWDDTLSDASDRLKEWRAFRKIWRDSTCFRATDVQKALTLASQQIQFFANGNPQKDSDKLIYR